MVSPRCVVAAHTRKFSMVEYDPFSPEVMSDPMPIYRALREAGIEVHALVAD